MYEKNNRPLGQGQQYYSNTGGGNKRDILGISWDTIRTSVCTSWKSVEGGIVLMKFKINIYVDIYFFQ